MFGMMNNSFAFNIGNLSLLNAVVIFCINSKDSSKGMILAFLKLLEFESTMA